MSVFYLLRVVVISSSGCMEMVAEQGSSLRERVGEEQSSL